MKEYVSHSKSIFFGCIIAILISAVICIKIINYESAGSLIFIYTLIITTFMLSRVFGSFFYKNYKDKMDIKNKIKLMQGYEPSVSFVIPCKNEEGVIYSTLKKCFEVDYPRDKLQIIVINDGSTDNTLNEMLSYKNENRQDNLLVINFKKNHGKRKAMYEGFKVAKGEIVIQVDSDSYPSKSTFKEILAPFVDKKVGATVGHTDPSNKNENIITKIQTAYYFMSFRALKATESIFDMVFCCSGCFSAYRKKYILPILNKWLNEKFMGKPIIFGDDRALTNWIIRQGYKTVYVDEAQAYTIVPNTLKKFLIQQTRWKKGWFINSINILPTLLKKDKFVAFTYFIPLILITLFTPIIAFKALILNPIVFKISPYVYILGILIVSCILLVHYKVYSKENYGRYMLLYSILNMAILTYVMIYALYDLRNMTWGTR